MQHQPGSFIRVLCACTLAACAVPSVVPVQPRGVPGFDTRDYPGDNALRRWREESPYRWVGYYLPAPCYTGTTWSGKRASLAALDWGMAVLFVGEQDWRAMPNANRDTAGVAQQTPRCSSANLTADHARQHAQDAHAAAAADGFPTGTRIFLDVERVERVSPELAAYVAAWTAALFELGRFTPALYAHDVNAPELFRVMSEEALRRGFREPVHLWVARAAGFELTRAPAESGYAVAKLWQGRFNTLETWGGAQLRIDVNVASTADPSGGR